MCSVQREHKIRELESECQILKDANEKLVGSAFDLEKEREWRAKEKALKLQIAQLEATLKADVGEKGGIIDKLCEQKGLPLHMIHLLYARLMYAVNENKEWIDMKRTE